MMKTLRFILLLSLVIPLAGKAQTEKIQAYYFHNAIRCETCRTVEAEAKADLQELYGNKVNFKALNLEDKSTQELAEKLSVSGQTLLIVKGNKKVNLTNEGFLYAVTNPEKFKAIIKEKVDPLIN
jgi:phage portal protein BeeE